MTRLWKIVPDGDPRPEAESSAEATGEAVTRIGRDGRAVGSPPSGQVDAVVIDLGASGPIAWGRGLQLASSLLGTDGQLSVALTSGLSADDLEDKAIQDVLTRVRFVGVDVEADTVYARLRHGVPEHDTTTSDILRGAHAAAGRRRGSEPQAVATPSRRDRQPSGRRRRRAIFVGGMLVAIAVATVLMIWTDMSSAEAVLIVMVAAVGLVSFDARRSARMALRDLRSATGLLTATRTQIEGQRTSLRTARAQSDAAAAMATSTAAAITTLHDAVTAVSADVSEGRTVIEAVAGEVGTTQETVRREAESLREVIQRESNDETKTLVKHISETSLDNVRRIRQMVGNELKELYRQLQAAENLFAVVPVEARIPPMRGWVASPDVMVYLVDVLLAERPGLVVECGSGVSTLWLALAARAAAPETRIVALEHQPSYADETRALLRRHGVDEYAEVRDAPLEDAGIDGHETQWYSRSAIADLDGVGLLFVDGPPEATGPMARLPALHYLVPRLAAEASVILDDTRRDDEHSMVSIWQDREPAFVVRELPMEKGAVHLRRTT